MKKWGKLFKCLIITLIGGLILVVGLLFTFYYLFYLPMTITDTSRVNNTEYRVIGAELFNSNIANCKPIILVLYIKNYSAGDLQKVGNVLNHFEIHERSKRNSMPIISKLDNIMKCPSFSIRICNLNLIKYYECNPNYRTEMIQYRRINEEKFCLTSDSGREECFDFKWTPKERRNIPSR